MSARKHWLDHPRAGRVLWIVFAVVLVGLLGAELTVEHHHDGLIGSVGFHAGFGLLVGALSIVVSKLWKAMLKRKDSYYD